MDVVMRVNMAEAAKTPPQKPPKRALVHPLLDFWLLGGLSFVGLGIMWLAVEVMQFNIGDRVPWWAYYAAFAVNYPHFAYSYQLFYKNYVGRLTDPDTGWGSRVRLSIAGIIVPMLMIGYFVQAGMLQDRELLAYGVSAMLFFVGWHYVKQGYGVLITTSVYKGIFYGLWQKRALYLNAYAIWAYAWLKANVMLAQHNYYDVSYYTIDLPRVWMTYAGWLVVVTSVIAAAVILWVWLKERKGITPSGIVGYASATYFWVLLPHVHPQFFFFVPLFHSLQYLPFVYKFKKSEFLHEQQAIPPELATARQTRYMRLGMFIFGGFALGALFMDLVPAAIDTAVANDWIHFSRNYFIVSFLLFINIHHFFIDSAFWRRDNKEVQQFLFRA
ncbi:MAG: hypothetical protein RBS08_05170 [Bdellovibrionales bacterium]|jgi:hypothetical protein|nr:hypothetical protein [Bdellovibrionales bacterium]